MYCLVVVLLHRPVRSRQLQNMPGGDCVGVLLGFICVTLVLLLGCDLVVVRFLTPSLLCMLLVMELLDWANCLMLCCYCCIITRTWFTSTFYFSFLF